jgi:hypothetical protein
MADKLFSVKRSDLGHSFLNAMWIAGLLAAIQLTAVTTALWKRVSADLRPAVSTAADFPQPAVKQVALVPPTDPGTSEVSPPPEVVIVENPPPAPPNHSSLSSLIRQMKAPDLSAIKDPSGEIADSLLARLVKSGVDDRARGDFSGALEAFLDVYENLPNHPRVLSEIAGTYGEMGNLELAAKFWNQVADLGPITAGSFHKVAIKVLSGEDPSIPEVEAGKFLKIGKIRVTQSPLDQSGEKVSLTIPVVGQAGESLRAGKMDLRVYFYDLINQATPGPTTASISYEFPTDPYDWKQNRTEEVEVFYHQPVFTVEQKQKLGERVYFGYVVELFYKNQLQDSVFSSEELRRIRFPAPVPVPDPVPPPQGPDSSLFPINR